MLLEEVGELHEQASTLARRAPLAPNSVVCAFCRVDGAVDIFCLSRRDPRNHLVGRRRTHFDCLAVRGRRVLVVDEEADRELCLGDNVPAREGELCGEVVLLQGAARSSLILVLIYERYGTLTAIVCGANHARFELMERKRSGAQHSKALGAAYGPDSR